MSHGGADFCLTVSALVVREGEPPRVLVHEHKRYPVEIPPGGHVDPGEHPWGAVLRELGEEAGIVADQLHVVTPVRFIPGPGRFPAPIDLDVHQVSTEATHTDVMFGFVIDGEPCHQPDEGESLALSWRSLEELAAQPAVPQRVRAVAQLLCDHLTDWPRTPASAVGLAVRSMADDRGSLDQG